MKKTLIERAYKENEQNIDLCQRKMDASTEMSSLIEAGCISYFKKEVQPVSMLVNNTDKMRS